MSKKRRRLQKSDITTERELNRRRLLGLAGVSAFAALGTAVPARAKDQDTGDKADSDKFDDRDTSDESIEVDSDSYDDTDGSDNVDSDAEDGVFDNDPDDGTVLCTYFYRKGRLSRELWEADTAFSRTLPRKVRLQYWRWAIPTVRRLREGDARLERLLWPVVKAWAHYAGYRMGVVRRFTVFGWLVHNGHGLLAGVMRRAIGA